MSVTAAARPANSRSRHLTPLLAPLLALGAVVGGAGCSDNPRLTRPDGGPLTDAAGSDAAPASDARAADATTGCVESSDPIDPTALIDDFEHAGSVIPLLAGRIGGWFSSGDATATSVMQPRGDAPPEAIPGGRCASRHALHVTGAGFLDWGSQVTVALNYGTTDAGISDLRPYDAGARGYHGVTFFARIGDTSVNTVRFAIGDKYSIPEAGLCVLDGGISDGCYDTFGVALNQALGTEWTAFRIPFSGLSQQSFGLQGPALDTATLYDLRFVFPPNVTFDLWVDDIRFY